MAGAQANASRRSGEKLVHGYEDHQTRKKATSRARRREDRRLAREGMGKARPSSAIKRGPDDPQEQAEAVVRAMQTAQVDG